MCCCCCCLYPSNPGVGIVGQQNGQSTTQARKRSHGRVNIDLCWHLNVSTLTRLLDLDVAESGLLLFVCLFVCLFVGLGWDSRMELVVRHVLPSARGLPLLPISALQVAIKSQQFLVMLCACLTFVCSTLISGSFPDLWVLFLRFLHVCVSACRIDTASKFIECGSCSIAAI